MTEGICYLSKCWFIPNDHPPQEHSPSAHQGHERPGIQWILSLPALPSDPVDKCTGLWTSMNMHIDHIVLSIHFGYCTQIIAWNIHQVIFLIVFTAWAIKLLPISVHTTVSDGWFNKKTHQDVVLELSRLQWHHFQKTSLYENDH